MAPGSVGACVGLMLIALLIVHDPAGTVGKAGDWGDTAGREVASQVAGAVRPGSPSQASEDGLDRGAQAIFDTIVLRPWCALEFGDVNFCLGKPPTDPRYYDGAGEFRDNAVAAPTVPMSSAPKSRVGASGFVPGRMSAPGMWLKPGSTPSCASEGRSTIASTNAFGPAP